MTVPIAPATSAQGGTEGRTADPRVRFAAERTLLAWIRTAVAMMGFGFVVARFGLFLRVLAATRQAEPAKSTGMSPWIGTGLVVLGVAMAVSAAWEHVRFLQRLARGESDALPRWSLAVVLALLVAGLVAVMVVYLLTVSH